jgi:hypothetical protein
MAIRLPLLQPGLDPVDRIEIPTPCSVPWDSMYGDQRVRHCGSCRKNVYNISEMTRAQALELIASREPVCVRIYRRPDGTVLTNDCWSQLRAARRRGMWAFLAMLVIVGWAQLAAMFVGVAGLRRLIAKPAPGSSAVAPVTAGAPTVRYADPPVRFDDGFAAGSHLPLPFPQDPPPKPHRFQGKIAKHVEHSPPQKKTNEGAFILGRRRPSP